MLRVAEIVQLQSFHNSNCNKNKLFQGVTFSQVKKFINDFNLLRISIQVAFYLLVNGQAVLHLQVRESFDITNFDRI